MYENLAQWDYVIAAYAVGLVALGALLAASYANMRRAEKRREEIKRR